MAVAPEVPAAGAFIVGLLALLVALGLLALRETVQTLIGSTLHAIAALLPNVTIFGHGLHLRDAVDGGIDDAVNYVASQLASWQLACDNTAHRFFRDSETLVRDTYDALASLAGATAHGIHSLTTSIVPGLIHDALSLVKPQVTNVTNVVRHYSTTGVKGLEREIKAEGSRIEAQLRPLETEVARLAHAVPIPIPHTIPQDAEGIRHWVDENLHSLEKRIDHLNGLLTTAALSGLIAEVLAKEIPWGKCTNTGKVAKKLCRFPVKWLEDLLGGAIDVLVVEDICSIIALMSTSARKVEPIILDFVDVADALIGCHGASKPAPIPLSVTAVPVVANPLRLAA